MAASKKQIWNQALGRLRAKLVTDAEVSTPTTKQALACEREYETVKEAALTIYPWSFATQRLFLQEYNVGNPGVADPEPLGIWVGRYKVFDSAQAEYAKPLRIVEVRSSLTGQLLDYEWTTDKDEAGTYQQWIFAETTSDIVVTALVEADTTEMPEYFASLVSWRLAEAIAIDLTDSVQKAAYCAQQAAVVEVQARRIELAQKRLVPLLRVRPHWSPMAARLGGQLAPVEGEAP